MTGCYKELEKRRGWLHDQQRVGANLPVNKAYARSRSPTGNKMLSLLALVSLCLLTRTSALNVPRAQRRVLLAAGVSRLLPLRPASAYDCKWSPDECARREAGSAYLSTGISAASAATRAKIGVVAETLRTIEPLLAAGKLAQAESVLTSSKLSEFTLLLGRLSNDDASAKVAAAELKKNFVSLAGALKQRSAPAASVYYEKLMAGFDRL